MIATKIIDAGLYSLVEISRRLKVSLLKKLFNRRKAYFIYISVAYNEFLDNSKFMISDRFEVVEFEKIMSELLVDDDKKKIASCLEVIYNPENRTKEPHKSIIIDVLKNMIDRYLNISGKKEKIVIVKDFRLFDLIQRKKKIYYPNEEMVNKNIVSMTDADQLKIMKTLYRVKDETTEFNTATFKSIEQLDVLILTDLKRKKKADRTISYVF